MLPDFSDSGRSSPTLEPMPSQVGDGVDREPVLPRAAHFLNEPSRALLEPLDAHRDEQLT